MVAAAQMPVLVLVLVLAEAILGLAVVASTEMRRNILYIDSFSVHRIVVSGRRYIT